MFDPVNGEKLAREIAETIVDVYNGDPDVDLDAHTLDDWRCDCEVAIGFEVEAYDPREKGGYGPKELSDLFAYVLEESGAVDEKIEMFTDGWMKYLAACVADIYEYGEEYDF